MRVAKDNFYCSNNFLLLQLNSDGIDDDNIQSLGHGQCVVEQRELFTLCKIPPLRRNFAWGAKYPILLVIKLRTISRNLEVFLDEENMLVSILPLSSAEDPVLS